MNYAFDFVNAGGGIDHMDLGCFAGDREAYAEARAALLVSTTAVAVEVWRDDQLLTTMRHPSRRIRLADRGPLRR